MRRTTVTEQQPWASLLECDEYTLRQLTDDGLQRLTQSRRGTSRTYDDLDDRVLLQMSAPWADKSL